MEAFTLNCGVASSCSKKGQIFKESIYGIELSSLGFKFTLTDQVNKSINSRNGNYYYSSWRKSKWSHMHFRVERVAQSTQNKNLKSKHTDPYVSIDLRKESNSANHVSVLFFYKL